MTFFSSPVPFTPFQPLPPSPFSSSTTVSICPEERSLRVVAKASTSHSPRRRNSVVSLRFCYSLSLLAVCIQLEEFVNKAPFAPLIFLLFFLFCFLSFFPVLEPSTSRSLDGGFRPFFLPARVTWISLSLSLSPCLSPDFYRFVCIAFLATVFAFRRLEKGNPLSSPPENRLIRDVGSS